MVKKNKNKGKALLPTPLMRPVAVQKAAPKKSIAKEVMPPSVPKTDNAVLFLPKREPAGIPRDFLKPEVKVQVDLVDITKVQAGPNAITLNQSTLNQGVLFKNRNLLENSTNWHKFVVTNIGNLERNVVLKAILDHVQPLDLIPVYYKRVGLDQSCFLARNCELAVKKLCNDQLVVENPVDKRQPFKLSLVLGFSSTANIKIDASKTIMKILKKRTEEKTVNLDRFALDPDLEEYCPLSQPKLLSYVLHLSNLSHPTSIVLSNNEIQSIVPLEAICGSKVSSLDLRNNLIRSLSDLEAISKMTITEIFLEGNPLCEKYDEYTYVQKIREFCPKIERVDGILLSQNGFPAFRRNFLCNTSGHELVDHFLDHYFTAFDSNNRSQLKVLYHKNALFSLSARYLPGQISSSSAHLSTYKVHGRNLLALADVSRSDFNLKTGSKEITDLFSTLPRTEHDPYSFTVDLINYTANCAMLIVTGTFRELRDNILDSERYVGFNRSFVLESISGEYCIINEQLHLFNALSGMQTKAFKHEPVRLQCLPCASTLKQKTQMVNAMKLITNLTTEWASRCLDECHYDLKKALVLFVDLYKADKIPPDGIQC